MKKLLSLTAVLFLAGFVWAGPEMKMEPITGSAELEMMKTLAGTWEGTHKMNGQDMTMTVHYKVTSNGSAVMETVDPGTPHEMVTMYHDDKGRLSMTHYCALGNQPAMDLKKAKNGVLEFAFSKKKSSLDSRKEMHMHSLTLRILDENTIQEEWTSYNDGKETDCTVLKLTRK